MTEVTFIVVRLIKTAILNESQVAAHRVAVPNKFFAHLWFQ